MRGPDSLGRAPGSTTGGSPAGYARTTDLDLVPLRQNLPDDSASWFTLAPQGLDGHRARRPLWSHGVGGRRPPQAPGSPRLAVLFLLDCTIKLIHYCFGYDRRLPLPPR